MNLSPFDPIQHGFRFPNCFVNHFRFGPLRFTSSGRCGGMSYVSLDYFFGGSPVPETTDLPDLESLLGKFIVRRQVQSLLNQLPGFANGMFNPFGMRSSALFRRCLPGGSQLARLRQAIDAGRPVPIGLVAPKVGVTDTHHQAVAVGYSVSGYDPESVRVIFYDPNHPGDPVTMIPDLANQRFRTELASGGTSRSWRMFFVDTRYRLKPVPQEPFALSPWLTSFLG